MPPVVVATLKQSALAEIQQLVAEGHYTSPGEFLELAAANQLQLERSRAAGRGPESAHVQDRRSEDRAGRLPVGRIQRPSLGSSDLRRPRLVPQGELAEALAHFSLPDDAALPIGLPLKPPPTPADSELRIWGQVNRVLPLKVGLRWLAVRAVCEKAWPRVEDVLEPIAADAATLGTALEKMDADANRDRDELLGTAMPRRGNTLSTDRFLSQYIVRTTRKGTIYPGAAVQYGMAALDDGRLALTTSGFEFASLQNPLLDGDLAFATTTLSAAEREYFVRQAIPRVPTELQDFSLVLGFVRAGHVTPSEQFNLFGEHLPREWSETMVRTHVSGVVARMIDLGLLRRNRLGRHVQYEITRLASEFFDLCAGDERNA